MASTDWELNSDERVHYPQTDPRDDLRESFYARKKQVNWLRIALVALPLSRQATSCYSGSMLTKNMETKGETFFQLFFFFFFFRFTYYFALVEAYILIRE